MNFIDTVKNVGSQIIFAAKKHSPEILVVGGIITAIGGAVLACKATLKAEEVIIEADAQIHEIKEKKEICAADEKKADLYTKEDATKDMAIVYTRTAVDLAKLYAPAIILGTVSVVSILSGTNILRKRVAGLTAAYATLNTGFKRYRDRVVERFGDEIDKQLKYNLKPMEVEETVVDEKGKEKKVKKTIDIMESDNPSEYSEYARFFDSSSPYWEKDSDYNLYFLRSQQAFFNNKLIAEKHVFLNDVYEALGLPKTKRGQMVGWLYKPDDPNRDNFVDFGIYDIYKSKAREFVNGYEKVILLDFNVDGNILKDISLED